MAGDYYGIDQEGVAFTLCTDLHLHCAMKVETRSTPEQFLALAQGLQSQLEEAPDDTVILVSIVMPCLYAREQVIAMIATLYAKVAEHQALTQARQIKEAQAGFEG